jgi:Ser/Thr protein kinase RdoA (MazF antagonist)
MTKLAYTYSQLAAEAVADLLAIHYALQQPIHCQFYVSGLHDNYLIESGGQRFIFRLYRNSWRTQEQIDFELELLDFLTERTSRVAALLRCKSGERKMLIDCPEGQRAGALFAYAEGIAPGSAISDEESLLLGQTVAAVHEITQTFHTAHTRPLLDIPYLLDASLVAIGPFVESDARDYLTTLQAKLHRTLPALPQAPGVYGICLGDVNPRNFHVSEDKRITLFDFDQCGYGYRAFEIAKFISSIHSLQLKQNLIEAFINGYQQVRRLHVEEVEAIPYFVIVAIIWVMAIHVDNVERIGYKMLEKPFWTRRLAMLKDLEILLPH